MFEHIKKTHQKRMRLPVRYQPPGGKAVEYVDKLLPDAIQEHARLKRSIEDVLQALRHGPHYEHPAIRLAIFQLSQVESPSDYRTPEELAQELGRLNGCLVETQRILARASGCQVPHIQECRFLAQYRQTARKRDLSTGWNRSAIDRANPKEIRINAPDVGPELK